MTQITSSFPHSSRGELFYGADYNPEQWSRETWDEDVKLMKQAGVNVVSLAIFSWAIIEVADDKWDFAWLDEVINLLHKNGIAVDLATATASPPPWLTKAHPEVLPVTKNGEILYPGGRQHWRPTSPIFRRYALRLVEQLAKRYGSHPAVIAWHVNNELGCHNNYDFSDDAAEAFRTWLKERYGTVDKLNFAWGTAFWSQHYVDFADILPPRQAATFPNPTQQLDWARFSSDALGAHLDAELEALHKHSPGVPVTTNYMLGRGTRGMDVSSWKVDFVSNDHYRVQTEPDERDELSFSANLTSGVAHGAPWWLMEHSTSAVNWQGINIPKRSGEMARDSLTHVAHGADAVCYFQWRQSKAGAEKYHSAMVPHVGPDSQLFRDVVKLGENMKALAEIRGSHRVTAPIAILFDWDCWWASELDSHPSSRVNYYREALDWFVALLDLGIRADAVTSRTDLSKYKVVIAPVLYLVDDPLQQRIHDYVHDGGHFITTYFSGIVDVNDHAKLGGYPGAFRDLLGIRIEEFAPLLDWDKVQLDDGTEATMWTDPIDIIGKSVEVIRKYDSGDVKGRPAVTRNCAGKGTAAYVSTRLGVQGLKKLLPDLLKGTKAQSTLPPSLRGPVEQVIRSDGHTEWEFLINRTDDPIDLKDIEGDLLVSTGVERKARLAERGIAVFRRKL
ncbi:hypothetical protein JCM24511_06189 [Saitozyma sp. JCM 24511]|nr:hypothetical protein JCM24511_06189 [Saitozyma sp. JCM 24511]